MKQFESSIEFAAGLDASDPVAGFRDRFHIPKAQDGSELIYFTGNSLGLMPKTARECVEDESTHGKNLHWKVTSRESIPWIPITNFDRSMARVIGAKPIERS